MGINFQRQEKHARKKEPQQEKQTAQWRLLPLLAAIVVLGCIAAFLYIYVFTSRLAFPAIVQTSQTDITTPVSGTVSELISEDVKTVKKGATVARIRPDRDVGYGPESTLNHLELKLKQARIDLEKARAKRNEGLTQLPVTLQIKKLDLRRELIRVNGKRREAEQELSFRKNLLKRRKQERKRINRLFRMDAATRVERRRANERYVDARADVRKQRQRLERFEQELDTMVQSLQNSVHRSSDTAENPLNRTTSVEDKQDRTSLQHLIDRLESSYRKQVQADVKHAQQRVKYLKRAIQKQKNILNGKTTPIPLEAPAGRRVLKRHVEETNHVEKGEPVVTIYKKNRSYVRAFVPPAYSDRLAVGQTVRIYVSGKDSYFQGTIERLHNQLEEIPDRPALHALADRSIQLPVDVSLPEEAREEVMINQACQIVVPAE